jgi:hypothetical protein
VSKCRISRRVVAEEAAVLIEGLATHATTSSSSDRPLCTSGQEVVEGDACFARRRSYRRIARTRRAGIHEHVEWMQPRARGSAPVADRGMLVLHHAELA